MKISCIGSNIRFGKVTGREVSNITTNPTNKIYDKVTIIEAKGNETNKECILDQKTETEQSRNFRRQSTEKKLDMIYEMLSVQNKALQGLAKNQVKIADNQRTICQRLGGTDYASTGIETVNIERLNYLTKEETPGLHPEQPVTPNRAEQPMSI